MAKKGLDKKIVIYALVGLGIAYVFWPAIKGFVSGLTSGEGTGYDQPGWY